MRLALIAAIACAPMLAHADATIAKGSVVKIEQREIYVSLGEAQGVENGATLRLKRTVKLKHPVTRAPVEDWIPVGSATITQAAGRLSRAIVGELVHEIRVGDVAEVLVEHPDAAPASPAPPRAQVTTKPVDPATADVLAAFATQSGASVDARIAAWEKYLSTHAGSPYGDAVRDDLERLRTLRDELQPANPGRAQQGGAVTEVEHAAPQRAQAGTPIPVVFVLARPEQVASAYLHFRDRDARRFQRILLAREHDIYLRGTIPAEAVKAPGLDYFVEVSSPRGTSGLALGSPMEPVRVEVAPPPISDAFGDRPNRTTLRLAGEYLDFALLDKRDGDHRDAMYSGSVDVSYDLGTIVQSVGVGYGVAGGFGGFADARWDDTAMPLPRTGFHYGHADVEFGERRGIVGGRLIAGVGKDGFAMGGEGHARIGTRDGTNLSVLARSLPTVGKRVDVRLGAQPFDAVLFGVSVGATDEPDRGDIAAKLGTDVEFIGVANFSLIVRASWQGRSIDHGGLGGGAGIGVTW